MTDPTPSVEAALRGDLCAFDEHMKCSVHDSYPSPSVCCVALTGALAARQAEPAPRCTRKELARGVVRLLLQVREHCCNGCIEDIDMMIERAAPIALDVSGIVTNKPITRALLDREITI